VIFSVGFVSLSGQAIRMPRKPRVEFEGAAYHVMCRGDHRESIVQGDVDRNDFLRCLEETCGKTEWQLHAYVVFLMPSG